MKAVEAPLATTKQEEQERRGVDLLDQLRDELELHAWLARAELRRPSLRHEPTRGEVDALVRLRDELRLQLHLGKLEARDRFEALEETWRDLMRTVDAAAEDAGEALHDLLRRIREGYARLRRRE